MWEEGVPCVVQLRPRRAAIRVEGGDVVVEEDLFVYDCGAGGSWRVLSEFYHPKFEAAVMGSPTVNEFRTVIHRIHCLAQSYCEYRGVQNESQDMEASPSDPWEQYWRLCWETLPKNSLSVGSCSKLSPDLRFSLRESL